MASIPAPPVPPKSVLNTQDQIETFKQMLISLEETAEYQRDAISYHTESLSILETESANTDAQLELCQKTIATLSKTQELEPAKVEKSSSNGAAKKTSTKTTKTARKAKAKTPAKTKSTKAKSTAKSKVSAKTKSIKATAAKATKSTAKKSTKQTAKKTQGKKSTLPPSPILKKFKNITAMVLDFAPKQDGVISVTDIIKYVYPKGLNEANHKKAFSSFSSVLSLYTRKGVFERTVPGKYLWIGK